MATFEGIWSADIDYDKKLDALADLCLPCAHCGCRPHVFHQDYIGDHFIGDEFGIECECGIGIDHDKWPVVISKWNKRTERI